jgi:hypothetical protein
MLDLVATRLQKFAIFGTALASNLKSLLSWSAWLHTPPVSRWPPAGWTNSGGLYRRDTRSLSLFWEVGYKASWKKAHICQNTVKYLGFYLS